MWLATKEGFFSVVAHRDDPALVLVRGRCRADLARLHALGGALGIEMPGIVETPAGDYGWRMFMEREAWETVAMALAMGIDYDNFKAAVHGDPDRDSAYLQMWTAMRRFQDGQRPSWMEPGFDAFEEGPFDGERAT